MTVEPSSIKSDKEEDDSSYESSHWNFMFADDTYVVSYRRDTRGGEQKRFKIRVYDTEQEEAVSTFVVSDLNEGNQKARRIIKAYSSDHESDKDKDEEDEEAWERLFTEDDNVVSARSKPNDVSRVQIELSNSQNNDKQVFEARNVEEGEAKARRIIAAYSDRDSDTADDELEDGETLDVGKRPKRSDDKDDQSSKDQSKRQKRAADDDEEDSSKDQSKRQKRTTDDDEEDSSKDQSKRQPTYETDAEVVTEARQRGIRIPNARFQRRAVIRRLRTRFQAERVQAS